mgnify:FL=1|tara:strand:+ start:254 stop:1012 length:759 start_codon:yes stop_codon:yes gene_type:complete
MTDGFVMSNNLDKMIRRSGMTNRAVAEEKGVKPETLSRHKSGAINMTRHDAEEYAQILGCTPQAIMYQSAPIPYLGKICKPNEKNREWHIERDSRSHWYSDRETIPCLYVNSYFWQNTACLQWQDDLTEDYSFFSGAMAIFNMEIARCDKVDPEAIMHSGTLNRERGTGRLLIGAPYPVPGKKTYTIYNQDKIFTTYEDIDIEWSAPLLQVLIRPSMLESEIVEVEKQSINEGHWCDQHHDHYTDRKNEPYS